VPFLLNISTCSTAVSTVEGLPYMSSRKTVNDDVRPATECAKPDPLAKLFVPLHFPERSNLSESETEQISSTTDNANGVLSNY
jgi:hypothetical protein